MLQAIYYTHLALQLWFVGDYSECTTQKENINYLKDKAVLPPSALTEKLASKAGYQSHRNLTVLHNSISCSTGATLCHC